MKLFRSVLFWTHLAIGLAAGIVIAIMSATGVVLAFQPQILAWLERDVRVVTPAGPRLSADAIVAAAMAARPNAQPMTASFEASPERSVSVSFGRDGTVYVDPYSGRVMGEGAMRARAFFQSVTEWHRWLAREGEGRQSARALTGAANFGFLILGITGLYIWMPRRWSLKSVRAIAWFQQSGTAKARDFNWHNVIGFWCAPAIVVMSATAVVMSYPWANRLVYQLAGSPLPQQQRPGGPAAGGPGGQGSTAAAEGGGRGAGPRREGGEGRGPQGPRGERGDRGERGGADARGGEARRPPVAPANLDAALARAAAQMPTWDSIAIRFAPRPGAPLSLTMVDGAYWNRYARSTLTIDGGTGEVARWEPYTAQSAGQKWRGWIRFAHTGELGGVSGQFVAGLGCLGGVFLVYTGIALAVRRCAAWIRRRRTSAQAIAASVLLLLSLGTAKTAAAADGKTGVLLLAHGGSASWNATVDELSKQLDAVAPTEAAFGMAQRASIQAAIDKLVARGVTAIEAVPLFVSSHSSVVESTRFLLGLRPDAPKDLAIFARMSHGAPGAGEHAAHGGADGTLPVNSPVPIRMGAALDRHPLVGEILASRARAVSTDPGREVVVLVAHGPVPDDDNARWLADMDVLAKQVAASAPYARVERLTVRDDAPAPVRDAATAVLRETVQRAAADGFKVLIVPHLLSYGGIEQGIRKRLDGFDYVMATQAIMPDPRVEQWVLQTAGLAKR